MTFKSNTKAALTIALLVIAAPAASMAQAAPYGAPISVDVAKQVAAVAVAEMRSLHMEMTIAIVDSGSNLVYLERSAQAGIGTIDAAIGKAKAANGIKAPTRAIQEAILTQNQINLLAVPGAFPVEGGVPLILDGQVVGAIGASGGMPSDDGAVANAGANSLLP